MRRDKMVMVGRAVVGLLMTLVTLTQMGFQGTYFNMWEKLGYHKRDILVERVGKARDGQQAAKEQFQTTLEKFKGVTNFNGEDLEAKYNELSAEYRAIISHGPPLSVNGNGNGRQAGLSCRLA